MTEYDDNNENKSYTAYNLITTGKSICGGYSDIMSIYLNTLGIQNYKVTSENHIWNLVNIDGAWYHLDVTWDDPILIGGGWLTDEYRYKYFLNGSNKFYNDHKEDGNIIDGIKFYYPVLSQKNY
jgi:transglutaminase/protease-like cytokinesis protein 3